MQTIFGIYDQVAEILARLDPQTLRSLKASEVLQQRFEFLVSKRSEGSLTFSEKDELDHFIVLERLFRLAKIRAEKDSIRA